MLAKSGICGFTVANGDRIEHCAELGRYAGRRVQAEPELHQGEACLGL